MTTRKRMVFLAALFLLALFRAAPAWAQPEVARAQLREKVREATMKRLIDRLGLDAPTAQRMNQLAKSLDDQLAVVQADTGKTRRELKRIVESGQADDASVNRLVERILANRGRMQQLEMQRLTEPRKILKPIDYGRLILVWPQVNREIKADIYRALAPNGKGGPADEE